MKKILLLLIFIISSGLVFSNYSKTPNLFIDCDGCDENYFREKIKLVNFVRDRADADIYVMINYLMTGSGGKKYTIDFNGMNYFSGINDTISYSIPPNTTSDFRRKRLTETINLGLVRYIMKTDFADSLNVAYIAPDQEISIPKEDPKKIDDPWDYWVFSTSVNSYFSGEKSSKSLSAYSSISADRVTDDWKIGFDANFNFSQNDYTYDTDHFVSITKSNSLGASVIKSLTDKLSAGAWGSYYQNTYSNINASYSTSAGIEYSVFPYSEANREEITIRYKLNSSYHIYSDTTIYEKIKEMLYGHSVSLTANFKQKWGNIYGSISWSNYLNDFTKNRLDVNTSVSVNVYKGLNLNYSIYFSSIHDQIALRASGASKDDLILKRKELETQYSYWGSLGISYQFGSIYSNFVNTRF